MGDAPERIWAWLENRTFRWWTDSAGCVEMAKEYLPREYIRADQAEADRRAAAEAMREECANVIDRLLTEDAAAVISIMDGTAQIYLLLALERIRKIPG